MSPLGGSGDREGTPLTPGQASGDTTRLGAQGKGLGRGAGLSPSGTNPAVHLRRSPWRPASPGSWRGQALSLRAHCKNEYPGGRSTAGLEHSIGTGMMGLNEP